MLEVLFWGSCILVNNVICTLKIIIVLEVLFWGSWEEYVAEAKCQLHFAETEISTELK